MKFGDKLIALRKKNGLSQEELAEKLNVSRQSVSKWESNNTYPETEKIVLICNLFNCSMDELINDKITDIEQFERKEKNNLNVMFDSLLEFVTKTVNMFAGMTFGSGFKCLVEMAIIALVLTFAGMIIVGISSGLTYNLFSFIQKNYIISDVIGGIISIIWFIIAVIVLVHVFKIRYLDYYERAVRNDMAAKSDNPDDKKESNKKDSLKNKIKNEDKRNIIIRDSEHEPFAFLSVLSKIVIYFIKVCAFFMNLGTIMALFGLVVCFVILVPFSFSSMLFTGINIAMVSAIVITTLVILLLFKFILGKEVNIKLYIIIFLVSIVVAGVGCGIGVIGLKDVEVKDMTEDQELATYEDKFFYAEDIFIDHSGYDIDYIVDNNIPTGEVRVNASYDSRLFKVHREWTHEDKMQGYFIVPYSNLNFKKIYNLIIKDLKNNIIRDYSGSEINSIKVIANGETINKLLDNESKMYLFNKEPIDGGYRTTDYDYRVSISHNGCDVNYNAITDEMNVSSPYCTCERKTIETSRGTRIEFYCKSTRDDDYYYEEYDDE